MIPAASEVKFRTRLSPVAVWVLLCALLNAIGWGLSALGSLNPAGYWTCFAISGVLAAWWYGRQRPVLEAGFRWHRLRRRLRRPIPLAFAIVGLLALVGGAVHAPNNYDALTYRLPRILHWLAAEQWHWIHTDFQRLNTRGAGIEWVSAPMLLAGWMRPLFLINAISFLLLPGLTFSLLSRLGVRRRVAWVWMWILPAGYGFILQAGSIANDLFGATFAMAAIDFAFRAVKGRSATAAWVSLLAAGLMTSAKPFNLVLLLPWGVALLPATRSLLRRPLGTLIFGLVALLASLLPTALLNAHYCGDWTGMKAEPVQVSSGAPGLHLVVNSILVVLHNFTPTFFPFAGVWNRTMDQMIPAELGGRLCTYFEDSAARFQLGEMPMEEMAGLGIGVSALLLTVLFQRPKWRWPSWPAIRARLIDPAHHVPWLTWGVTLYLLTQMGLACPARYLAPAYVILAAPLLCSCRARALIDRVWWRGLVVLTLMLAAALLIAIPARPLWPATTVLRLLGADKHPGGWLARAWRVYSVYEGRADGFAPIRQLLPADVTVVGWVGGEDPEISLWQPLGARRVVHVTAADDAASLPRRGIEYVVISEDVLQTGQKTTYAEWLDRYHCEPAHSLDLLLKATRGPARWHLARVRPEAKGRNVAGRIN
jgi:hypothetical protein